MKIKVRERMREVFSRLSGEANMKELIDVLAKDSAGRVLIMEGGGLSGIITTRDVVKAIYIYDERVWDLRAKDLMTPDVKTISSEETVDRAVRKMIHYNIGALPVVVGYDVAGLFTEREVLSLVRELDMNSLVDPFMSIQVKSLEIESPIETVIGLMARTNIRRIPLTQDGKVVGLITASDIVKALARGRDLTDLLSIGTQHLIWISRYERATKAADIMFTKRVGSLLVSNDGNPGQLVGIVTERDLVYSLLE